MKVSSYDPYVTDMFNSRFSSLSLWDNSPRLSMLRMGNNVDLGHGHEVIDLLKPLDLDKLKVGDDVYFGNSRGIVTELLKSVKVEDLNGRSLPIGSVIGIEVKRYLNYLRPEDRDNPVRVGYDEDGDGVTMRYYFYQGLNLENWKNGGGSLFMYPGSFYVVVRNKVGSYPSVYDSILEYQGLNKLDPIKDNQ